MCGNDTPEKDLKEPVEKETDQIGEAPPPPGGPPPGDGETGAEKIEEPPQEDTPGQTSDGEKVEGGDTPVTQIEGDGDPPTEKKDCCGGCGSG
ncbi:MAG: hypothetical protein WC805_02410 [Patescibacteria group bacterium]|jgi:hypothetical protein